jgi:hypothetical protein
MIAGMADAAAAVIPPQHKARNLMVRILHNADKVQLCVDY